MNHMVDFADGGWSVFAFEFATDYALLIVVDMVVVRAIKTSGTRTAE